MITGDKMLGYLDRISGEHKPITADIFLTNYCNNNCPYCTYKRWDISKDAWAMSFDNFKKYVTRLRSLGVMGYILTGGGEPTLNPEFDQITAWLESENLHYGINTNFNVLKYFKPNYLKVSLDGYDENSYERSRGVRKYEQVVSNIKAYAEWKKENSPKTSLGIQFVADSVEAVRRFYSANKSLEVDYISFRPFESTAGSYYATSERKGKAQEIISAIEGIAEADSRVTLNFKWDLIGEREDRCTAQWAQIAVNEKGDVIYCCHKPYQIVGHVMDEDILEKKEKAGTNMDMCDIPCRMTAPNKFVHQAEIKREDSCFI